MAIEADVKFTSNLQETFNTEALTLSLRSLTGVVQSRCRSYLGTSNVFLSFVKNYRQSILTLQRLTKGKNLTPPYLMLGVTGISVRKDVINLKAAARSGIPLGLQHEDGVSNGQQWMEMYHQVPIGVDIVFTYVDSDVSRIIHFVTFLSSALSNNLLTHTIKYDNLPEFEVQISADAPGFQTGKDDWIDLETEGMEGLQSVEIPARMNTTVGFTSKKPAVRANGVEITVASLKHDHTRGTIMEVL